MLLTLIDRLLLPLLVAAALCLFLLGAFACGDDKQPAVDAGVDAGCLDYCAAVVCPPEVLCDAGVPDAAR